MRNTWLSIPLLLFLATVTGGFAFAADLPKEGSYDFIACYSGVSNTIVFSKTHRAVSYEQTGTTLSNPPGGFLDKRAFHCVGMATSFDGKSTNTAVCESLGTDDDKLLTYFSLGADGKVTREVVAGTGKYEGIVSSGIAQPLGPFPAAKAGTFQDCNHQTGTYKLR